MWVRLHFSGPLELSSALVLLGGRHWIWYCLPYFPGFYYTSLFLWGVCHSKTATSGTNFRGTKCSWWLFPWTFVIGVCYTRKVIFLKTLWRFVLLLSCPPTALPCALLQGTAVIKRFSGFENTIPSSRKDEVPNCMVSAVSKQDFAIYVDDPEDKENYSCQVSEDLEFGHCELNTSAMTSSIHLLLDLSSGISCYCSHGVHNTTTTCRLAYELWIVS